MFLRLKCNDTVYITEGDIAVHMDNQRFQYKANQISIASIFTINQGPWFDDIGLVLIMVNEDKIVIMSEHPDYERILFDELNKIVQIDYKLVLAATTRTESDFQIIYQRGIVG